VQASAVEPVCILTEVRGERWQQACFAQEDPVLVALGDENRSRLMWKYYKSYVQKRLPYGKAARMPYKPGSHVGQLAFWSST